MSKFKKPKHAHDAAHTDPKAAAAEDHMQVRIMSINMFFGNFYFDHLLQALHDQQAELPQTFVRRVFSAKASEAVGKPIAKERLDAKTLLERLDRLECHTHLLTRVSHEYYAKVLPVIQSSGFGKTRMCVQLSIRHPGMLVCLRGSGPQEQHLVSFPPQDSDVYSYFLQVKSDAALLGFEDERFKSSENAREHTIFNKAHLRILAWLSVYCQTLLHYLDQLKSDSDCFDQHGRCKHTPNMCWRTVVYHFANATSFKQHNFFPKPIDLCPQGRLDHLYDATSSSALSASIACATNTSTTTNRANNSRRNSPDGKEASAAPPALIGTPNLRKAVLEHICASAETRYTNMLTQYASTLDDTNLLIQAIRDHLTGIIDDLESLPPPPQAAQTFFLALDECGSIATILPLIRRVWFHAGPASTWILLVDTNSYLAPLAGTAARTGSRRTSDYDTHRLAQPFSAMPLDVNLTYQERQALFGWGSNGLPSASIKDLNLALPKLGRPLWNDKKYHTDGLINARAILGKLVRADKWQWPDTGSTLSSSSLDSTNQNLLALVSSRIPLELTSKAGPEQWYAFVSQQIAHHLRFVGRIFSTSDAIISSTPSEPSLSAAAAWSFRSHDDKVTAANWSLIVQAIVIAMAPVGINIGAQGEQGVALACSMAVDLAVSKRYRTALAKSLTSRPTLPFDTKYDAVFGLVTVREWLETLAFQPAEGRDEASSDPMDVDTGCADEQEPANRDPRKQLGSSRLAAWADRAWLNFKHMVRLPKQIPHGEAKVMRSEVLLELWFRNAAAQGISNQEGWDILIPIYESDDDKPPKPSSIFDKARLSYVAIQVKNCIKRPDAKVLAAPVGPNLCVAQGTTKECLELFIDLKATNGRHVISQRPAMPSPQGMLRHHILVAGSALCVLDRLTGPARNVVGMLFGNADSLDTLEFDNEQAKYVQRVKNKAVHQEAWNNAQARIEGVLVGVTQEPEADARDALATSSMAI
ncbi:uncharacterized protein SPSC_00011 [Sporisorium scitamineum]|uniref:Uncharacterized protein n=1 Tax=Sporisorium scitamineum TaxID=49012 RepID=A0A140KLW0_9BASI|nr:uncharacterized protein SPSC_00011 [Sporisorium scitamineum]